MAAIDSSGIGSIGGAANNLSQALELASQSVKRLSSALEINQAADDPAGLAISETLRAEVRELNRTMMNAMDEASMLQVADSGMGEITGALQNVRELTVQAGNPILTDSDRATIQEQINAELEHAETVAQTTEFNTKTLLMGELGGDMSTGALGIAGVDVTTPEAAGEALGMVGGAIEQVGAFRAELGARQNELISTMRSTAVAAENTLAAESRIRDLDYAQEVTNSLRAQLLAQASAGALAQANLQSSAVLSLLSD